MNENEEGLGKGVDQADKMSETEFDRVAARIFKGHNKTAAELVSEERDR